MFKILARPFYKILTLKKRPSGVAPDVTKSIIVEAEGMQQRDIEMVIPIDPETMLRIEDR